MELRDRAELITYLSQIGIMEEGQEHSAMHLPNPARIEGRHLYGSDALLVKLSFEQIGDTLRGDGYRASLLQLPGLQSGLIAGIDVAALDHRLDNTNWNVSFEALLAMDAHRTAIIADLIALSEMEVPEARQAAGVLMLRHWSDTELEPWSRGVIDRSRYERSFFFTENEGLSTLPVLKAYHLLSGRPALHNNKAEKGRPSQWIKIKDGNIFRWPEFDLTVELKRIGVAGMDGPEAVDIKERLEQGERVETALMLNATRIRVDIEANPDAKSVSVFPPRLKTKEVKARQVKPGRRSPRGGPRH